MRQHRLATTSMDQLNATSHTYDEAKAAQVAAAIGAFSHDALALLQALERAVAREQADS